MSRKKKQRGRAHNIRQSLALNTTPRPQALPPRAPERGKQAAPQHLQQNTVKALPVLTPKSSIASPNSLALQQTDETQRRQPDIIRLATLGQTRLHNLGQYLKEKRIDLSMSKREAMDDFSNALSRFGFADLSRDNDWLNRVERSNQRLEPAELWALLTTYKCDEAEKVQILLDYGFLDCFSPDPRHRQIMAVFGRVYFDIIANERMRTTLAELIERSPDLTLSPGDCLFILSSVVSLFGNPLPHKAVVLPQQQIRRV